MYLCRCKFGSFRSETGRRRERCPTADAMRATTRADDICLHPVCLASYIPTCLPACLPLTRASVRGEMYKVRTAIYQRSVEPADAGTAAAPASSSPWCHCLRVSLSKIKNPQSQGWPARVGSRPYKLQLSGPACGRKRGQQTAGNSTRQTHTCVACICACASACFSSSSSSHPCIIHPPARAGSRPAEHPSSYLACRLYLRVCPADSQWLAALRSRDTAARAGSSDHARTRRIRTYLYVGT